MNANEIGSDFTGSPEGEEGSVNTGSPVDQEQFKNLEQAFGKQGQELGEYRKFFADVSPLLDKLDKSPELVQAIIDGKVDAALAQAAIDGKISFGDAETVTKANTEVKKELGKKAYNEATPEELSSLVEDKVAALKTEMWSKMKEDEDLRNFDSKVKDFISNTPDFADYSKEINTWLDNHDVADIEIAYYAVKGQLSEKAAKQKALEEQGEYAKDLALNAGGGSSRTTYSGEAGAALVDRLISGKSNPNVF